MYNNKNNYINLYESWKERINITLSELDIKVNKPFKDIKVDYREDLVNKYLNNFFSYSEILKDLKLINKNQSVRFIYNGKPVGGVICDAAKKNVSDHFGHKLIAIVKAHPSIYRGKKTYINDGKMVRHSIRANFLALFTIGTYVYKKKNLNPDIQKIYVNNGDSLAK